MGKYLDTPTQTTRMPGGIPFIIGNELAERFSFYGMKGILTVYMTKHLLDSAGQPDYMTDEEAKATYHLFTAAAYFFPLLGSLIADILLGKYMTIIVLSLAYCVGHGCLALGDTGAGTGMMEPRYWLFGGLIFIALGAGGIKPCVSAHVGDQFGEKNQGLIPMVFAWFYFSINVGSTAAMLLIPVLLDKVGPWAAFGLPGVLMALATFVFWLGRNRFVHIPAGGLTRFKDETFSPDGRRALLNLTPMFLIFVPMFWAIFDQTGSAWVLQADHMNREFLGVTWLPSQVQAVNPILILILIPVFTYICYPMLGFLLKVTPLRRVSIGLFLTAIAFGLSGMIEMNIKGGEVTDLSTTTSASGWMKQSLLEEDNNGYGWASAAPLIAQEDTDEHKKGDVISEPFPAEITIRLRERKAWNINSVELNPYAVIGPAEASNDDLVKERDAMTDEAREALEATPDRDNWARNVTILVRNADAEGDDEPPSWVEVATIELAQENELQPVTFDSVEATHVRLRVESSWGGDRAKLGRVRVLSSDPAPADADNAWPDVAAIGFKPNIGWQFLAYLLLTAAEVMVSITTLEFAYTQAPKRMKSFIMGIYFLGVSFGNFFVAGVNHFIEVPAVENADGEVIRAASVSLEGADYYWFFTILMFIVAVIFIPYAMMYRGKTFIQGDEGELEAESEAEAIGN